MTRAQNPNLEMLMLAVDKLEELADEMVFVGGCATGLLINDPAAPPIRVTRDVDAIVQVYSHREYHQLSEKLRNKGFAEDSGKDAPICRWQCGPVILDVMPTEPTLLGFGNRWYEPATKNAQSIKLPSGQLIQMVSAPYFLITKLEAFDGRGGGDFLLSHDIEDLVAVLDGRQELVEEVKGSEPRLVTELAFRFQALQQDDRFVDSISGHMPTDEISQRRVDYILQVIKQIALD